MNDNNVIQFPLRPRVRRLQEQVEEKYMNKMMDQDDAVNMAQYLFDIIKVGLQHQDWVPDYQNLDMNDGEKHESQDMFVILNLLSAMLLRYKGYAHMLQADMDKLAIKLRIAQDAEGFDYDDDYWDDEE